MARSDFIEARRRVSRWRNFKKLQLSSFPFFRILLALGLRAASGCRPRRHYPAPRQLHRRLPKSFDAFLRNIKTPIWARANCWPSFAAGPTRRLRGPLFQSGTSQPGAPGAGWRCSKMEPLSRARQGCKNCSYLGRCLLVGVGTSQP